MLRACAITIGSLLLATCAYAYLAYEFGDPPSGYYTPTSGWSTLGVGDVDADGCEDLALTMRFDPVTQDDAQTTWVLSGRSGTPIYAIRIDESLYDERIAPDFSAYTAPGEYHVHAVGDVNDDRHADLALNFRGTYDGKTARGVVISGSDASLLLSNLPTNAWNRSEPGSVRALDDVDHDGRVDLLVSLLGNHLLGIPGRIVLVSGRDGRELYRVEETPRLTPLAEYPRAIERTDFGSSVHVVRDTDGDSIADFQVSAPMKRSTTCYSGASGRELWTRSYSAGHNQTTSWDSLFFVGDADGDGVSDVVGSKSLASAAPPTTFFVASGESYEQLFEFEVENTLDVTSICSSAGDVNGDRTPDLVVTTNRDLVAAGRRQRWSAGFGVVTIRSGKDGSVLRTFDRDALVRLAARDFPRIVIR